MRRIEFECPRDAVSFSGRYVEAIAPVVVERGPNIPCIGCSWPPRCTRSRVFVNDSPCPWGCERMCIPIVWFPGEFMVCGFSGVKAGGTEEVARDFGLSCELVP